MAGQKDITVVAGDGYTMTITPQDENGDPLDQTGWTWRASVRRHASATEKTDFTVTNNGTSIQLDLTGAQTREISERGVSVWDVERQQTGGEPETILAGTFRTLPDVTREA